MNAATKLSHKKHLGLVKDYEKTAKVANLMYVSDNQPGINRIKAGKGFSYKMETKKVSDKELLTRIKKLAIPPAWQNVWICLKDNGHIQATGLDVRMRKQYRYHPLWTVLRNETKFHKMIEFGKALPALRLQMEKDLSLPDLCDRKVIAAVIALMERTYIRIGNNSYEKMYGSHGLTTLHDKHVKINGSEIKFSFNGKKSVAHDISLQNKKLAKVVKECRDIPGKELFQYYDENGQRKTVDSGMVNNYIKNIAENTFSAKDFRTWAGCLHFLIAFKNNFSAAADAKPVSVNSLLDEVSKQLGNTRTVCKKYYVHPGIVKLFEENKLQPYADELDAIEKDDNYAGLTSEEKVLMKLLETIS